MLLCLLPLLAAPAQAAEPGYYHPDEVAAGSELFVAAAKQLGPAFEEAQADLTRLSTALEQLDATLLLLGDRAPTELTEWATSTRKQVTGQYLQLQRHIDLVQQDYGDEFGAAVQRAIELESADYTLKECGASGISALMGRGSAASCSGSDRNAALAARLDQDPKLKAFVDEMGEIPWPEIGVEARTWEPVPVTGTDRWIAAEALSRSLFSGAMERHNDALEDALDPLYEGLESGDADAVRKGEAARAAYAAAVGADGATLLDAMQATLEKRAKKGGPEGVGVCPVPKALGGCSGADATKAVLTLLKDDKKFSKATAGMQ